MKNSLYVLSIIVLGLVTPSCSKSKTTLESFVNNQGVKISYSDIGKGDTTLLFVHGWCLNKTYWDSQVTYFKNKYRIVTMDLGGYGKSGHNREFWNTPQFATDVNTVIDSLHLKNLVLVGHSMSGDIVVESAINHQKQVLAIVGVDDFKNVGIIDRDSIKSRKGYQEAIAQAKKNFKSVAYPYVTQQLFYKTTPISVRKKIMYDLANTDTIVAVQSLEWDHLSESAELKKANKPLFIISSDVHKTDTSALHSNHIPVHLSYIHAVGHFPMIEKPKEFNKILAAMLAQIK